MQISMGSQKRQQNIKRWHVRRAFNEALRYGHISHKERVSIWKDKGFSLKRNHVPFKTIKLPSTMFVDPDHPEFLETIWLIREAAKKRNPIRIDFSSCTKVSVEACVVLVAELERFSEITRLPIIGNRSNDETVTIFLRALGFFKFVGLSGKFAEPDVNESFDILGLLSGTRGRPQVLNEAVSWFISGERDGKRIDRVIEQDLTYSALVEAMNNSITHGYNEDYKNDDDPWLAGKWWATGIKNFFKNESILVFYDQGVGIPTTVPHRWATETKNLIERLMQQRPTDGELIRLATRVGNSSTGQLGRGNGLKQMKELLKEFGDGSHFRIASRQGDYVFVNRGLEGDIEEEAEYSIALPGTLMVWKFKDFTGICNENN